MFYSVWSSFFPIILLSFFYSTSEALSLLKQDVRPAVVAHFMVGNTYPYTAWDWIRDIRLASSKGLDAFALNLGVDSWQPDRIANAFEAADFCSSADGITFKLFLSFDMTSLPCSDSGHAQLLQRYVDQYSHRSSYFQYKGLPVISTFAGERCSFGQPSLNDAWNFAIKSPFPASRFIPSFFVDPSQFSSLPVMDGAFNWNSGWPQENEDINFKRDNDWINQLGGRIYMAAVSPWFFTHYGPDTYNKNWIYRSDDWLFAERWEQLIDERARVDIVQVISWNDYGESHYVGPIEGDQPNSEAWTTEYDHQGWLDLMQYYISAYVTGEYPPIYRDRAFVWGRRAPAGADTGDRVGKPYRWQYAKDAAWGIVHLASPADVTLSCGLSTVTKSFLKGPSKIVLFLEQDCDVNIRIVRHGSVALDWSPPGYTFNTHPTSYNFNAFVAAY